jgi:hypothetical protein
MKTIQNVQPLSAEKLFDLLKKEFPAYIDAKLDSSLAIDFAHVADVINISFPEVIEGTALTITVTDDEISLSKNATETEYNTGILEEQLVAFLEEKCG